MVLMGPHDTFTASITATHSSVLRVTVISLISATNASRWRTRCGFVSKRSSCTHSGRPRAVLKAANWPSLPTVTIMWPSPVGKSW